MDVVGDVREFVERCLEVAHLRLSCQCEDSEDTVTVSLSGEDANLVLRDNARLLYALNHLVSQAFYRRTQGERTFLVDCEDYRNTRVMELQLLARKAAEKVRSSGRPFRLQPMPAGERRVIHLSLAEELGVTTMSEGRGVYRRVVIFPSH